MHFCINHTDVQSFGRSIQFPSSSRVSSPTKWKIWPKKKGPSGPLEPLPQRFQNDSSQPNLSRGFRLEFSFVLFFDLNRHLSCCKLHPKRHLDFEDSVLVASRDFVRLYTLRQS